jgi:tetratricopeptide (TPR) repeat protein
MGKLHALALLVVAGTAAAQPQPSPAAKQQASNLVKQAIAKSQAGDHATAIELYLQAYALIPQPLLLSNIGSEYQQEPGKQVEALKYFCKYLEADPTGSNASYATAQAKALQIELGNQVDDANVCKPAAPPPPPPDTSAQVTGTADIAQQPPPAGEGHGKALEYTGLGVAAVGAVGLGVGVYFGLQAKDVSDQISNHKPSDPWPADIKQLEARGQSDENKQIGFLIGGGVALAAGTVMYFVGKSHASSGEHVSIVPLVTPDSAGLSLGGSY